MIEVPSDFPSLPSPYRIAFIGEAPSDEELIKGHPLVGPSGRVFNAGLRAAGIDREKHFVGNVFSRKAPDNDTSDWQRDPLVYEPEFERLADELVMLEWGRPDVIVPLGGTALWAFTGSNQITRFRGAVQTATRIAPGAKLLPTFHPAFVIKQWKLLAVMVGDFMKAEIEAKKGPEIVYPDVRLLLEPTIEEVEAYCDGPCLFSDLLSEDIETGWGQITMVGLAPSASECMVIPFVDFRKPHRSYWATPREELRAWAAIKRINENKIVPKLGQNFPYDAFWLWNNKRIAIMNYRHDTRLMHHALFPELPKDLGFMAARYTDVGAYKHWGGKASEEKRDD